jgi:Domain of unknown function (DUF4412)
MLRFARAVAVASLACVPAALFAQSHFEGAITARMGNGQKTEVTFLVKGDQFRMDMAERGGMMAYMLHDMTKSATYMVVPSQRMYMEMSQMTAEPQGQRKPLEMKSTGKTETIAGRECEHVIMTSDDGQHDVCVAKGMGTFFAMNNPMGTNGGAALSGILRRLGRDVFPLKVQEGNEVSYEVTKIEKKSLDDALFKLPDDFTKMDMGGMGRRGKPPI